MRDGRALRDELHEHGRMLAGSLGLARNTGTALADALLLQYGRWPRRYHDARHLLACVREAEAVRTLSPAPDAIAFALWFHDAIYWPWRRDNEMRSAAQARDAALNLGLGGVFAARVHALVMATAHLAADARTPGDPAADWVLDIDLGILGAHVALVALVGRRLRAEYFFVTPRRWRRGRAAVLRHFLGQESVYRTAHFRDRLEAQARDNLRRALASME